MLDRIDEWFGGDHRAIRVILIVIMINVAIFGSIVILDVMASAPDCSGLCLDEMRQKIEGIVGVGGNEFDPKEGLDKTFPQ